MPVNPWPTQSWVGRIHSALQGARWLFVPHVNGSTCLLPAGDYCKKHSFSQKTLPTEGHDFAQMRMTTILPLEDSDSAPEWWLHKLISQDFPKSGMTPCYRCHRRASSMSAIRAGQSRHLQFVAFTISLIDTRSNRVGKACDELHSSPA